MSRKKETMAVYDGWYDNNRSAILAGEWNLVDQDILLNPKTDHLRGLNLLAFLPDSISEAIDNRLVPKIKEVIGPSGWYFPRAARHLTVLDMIPHNSGLSVKEVRARAPGYAEVVSSVVAGLSTPIKIGFEGVFASPDGVTVQGYPLNNGLAQFRQQLREELEKRGLINLEGKKYFIETAHAALLKLTGGPNGRRLLEVVDGLRSAKLESFSVGEMVLNISPRYDKTETIEVIEKYSISI
jgi:hypothetical protein